MNTSKLFFFMVLCSTFTFAQVGVNIPSGSSVDPSAAFEIKSGSSKKGLLTPRMTTAERLSIVTPADGLIVYDTEIGSFYYYKSAKAAIAGPPATPASLAAWVKISNDVNGRLNFKRIKSTDVLATVLATELAAGGGAKYQLNTNTLYEINGTVVFDKPIDLNKSYLQGLDSGDDIVVSPGNIFDGATGGTVKGLTLSSTGGKVFNLNGANTENFIFRDCIVANSASVGSINGLGLVFISVVQFSGNTTGITYSNISQLLLSNLGWFGNNKGTFEKLTGTFGLVQKQGGFSDVTDAASTFAFDVSGNPTITGDAVLESVVFTGDPTGTGAKYVNKYTAGSYTGYNFNNSWNVRSTGIPTEADATATSILYKTNNRTSATTTATNADTGYKVETTVTTPTNTTTTTATNLFRFVSTIPARLTYKGKKTRAFQAAATISFEALTGSVNTDYVFYFAKIASNGTTVTPLPETETYIDTNSSFIQAFPISGTVVLAENESVELYLKRITNTGSPLKTKIDVRSYNLSLK